MAKSYYIFSAQYLPSSYGGVERYTNNLAKKLVKSGNNVTVITSNVQRLKEYEINKGITIYRLPCFNLLKGRFPVLKFNLDFFRLVRNLKINKPDLVIVNTRFYIHSLFGVRFAKKIKTNCIAIEHGTSHLTIGNKFLDGLGHLFEHFITVCVKHYCKDFYGVSKACNEWLIHFNILAKSTIYNSIDIENINNIIDDNHIDIKNKYKLRNDDIIISFTGRLVKEKGILNLIYAMEKINKEYKNVYLFIAGEGPLLEKIEAMKIKNIVALGKVQFSEVVVLLNETNIFCLPSESEGFSTSILEAAACKCFIITTKQGGSKELIINKEYGVIMDNNDVSNIYEAIIKALKNSVLTNRAVENTYNRLIENFTWNIAAEKVINICKEADELNFK